mgnify:FL=1
MSMLKNIIQNPEEIIKKIKNEYDFTNFFGEARENPQILKKFFNKEQIEKLAKFLAEKIEKEKEVKKTFKLSSNLPTGIYDIKEILSVSNIEIRYLGSSRFSISAKARDFKEANKKLSSILQNIERKAKERKAHFEILER